MGGEGFVADAEAIQVPRCVRLEDDIGGAGEFEQLLPARGGLEVEGEAALVAVDRPPCEGLLGAGLAPSEGAFAPKRCTTGRLNNDDVGAEVAEDLAGYEGIAIAEIEDAVWGEQGEPPGGDEPGV